MNQSPKEQDILSAIDQVKAHRIFNRSPLMCAFLSYVSLETMQGRESRISAYSVAVDALGKPTDFDPQMDPSVRVLAKRLRDSLTSYYEEATDYTVRIVLKPGSYVPSFHHAQSYSVSSNGKNTSSDTESGGVITWTPPVVFYRPDDSDPNSSAAQKKSHVAT